MYGDLPNSYHHWTVIGPETWNETASTGEDTVSLSGDIVVFPGATLTISAGTVIEFAAGQDRHQFSAGETGVDDRTEIFVYGTLVANGTATDSVRFQKSGTAGGIDAWGGIRKMDGGSVILDYTEIRDTLPGRPTDLQAERGDAQATLRWTKPNHFGITGWKYRSGTMAGTDTTWAAWQAMDSSDGDTDYHSIEDLVNGTTYTFQVRAVNPTGDGPSSGASAAVIPAGPPAPPEVTVGEGHEEVVLSWTPGDANGSAIQRHELRYSGDGGTTWNPDWRTHSVRSDTIGNLLNDTEYTFQMRARNEVDYSEVAEVKATPRHPIRGRAAVDFAEHRVDTVATYRFRAPASSAEVTYRLEVSDIEDSTHFELSAQGGLSFRVAPNFEAAGDANGDNLYGVWLRAAPVPGNGGPLNPRAAPPPTFTKRVEVTVTDVNEPGTVSLSPDPPRVGQELVAVVSDPDGVGNVRWRWAHRRLNSRTRSSDPPISSEKKVTPPRVYLGRQLRATATYDDRHGRQTAQSEYSGPIIDVPSVPRQLAAESGNRQLTFTWQAPEKTNHSAVTGYGYCYFNPDTEEWTPGTVAAARTDTTITGLTNGTDYTFELWATNEAGDGPKASVSERPRPPPPDAPDLVEDKAVSTATRHQVWLRLTEDHGDPIWLAAFRLSSVDGQGGDKQWHKGTATAWQRQRVQHHAATIYSLWFSRGFGVAWDLSPDRTYTLEARAAHCKDECSTSGPIHESDYHFGATATYPLTTPPAAVLTISGPDSVWYAESGTDTVATYRALDGAGQPASSATWTLLGPDWAVFTEAGDTLRFRSPPDFEAAADQGGNNRYQVTVRAAAAGPPAADTTLQVTVTVINEDEPGLVRLSTARPTVQEDRCMYVVPTSSAPSTTANRGWSGSAKT